MKIDYFVTSIWFFLGKNWKSILNLETKKIDKNMWIIKYKYNILINKLYLHISYFYMHISYQAIISSVHMKQRYEKFKNYINKIRIRICMYTILHIAFLFLTHLDIKTITIRILNQYCIDIYKIV
jgi:hypothetical protein